LIYVYVHFPEPTEFFSLKKMIYLYLNILNICSIHVFEVLRIMSGM
jgi:hypothetical protein